jgi:hypothetical protein
LADGKILTIFAMKRAVAEKEGRRTFGAADGRLLADMHRRARQPCRFAGAARTGPALKSLCPAFPGTQKAAFNQTINKISIHRAVKTGSRQRVYSFFFAPEALTAESSSSILEIVRRRSSMSSCVARSNISTSFSFW